MQISYHGHSIVKIVTGGKTILIDPFINGNKLTDLKAEDEKPDVILLTHGHNDHVGDTVAIAKACDALVVAPNELANYLAMDGVKTHGMNIGGSKEFDFGTVKFTKAFHSSSYTTENNEFIYTGMPTGILFTAEGKTIYHAGDTSLFGDMELIGKRHPIDVAFCRSATISRWGRKTRRMLWNCFNRSLRYQSISIHSLQLNKTRRILRDW